MQLRTRRVMRGLLAALADERRSQTMSSRDGRMRAEGIIQWVDPLNRELVLLSGRRTGHGSVGRANHIAEKGLATNENLELVTFDVAMDCLIFLNGERVKMRMLQPMDRAAIQYTPGTEHSDHERLVAHSISIDSELTFVDDGAEPESTSVLNTQ